MTVRQFPVGFYWGAAISAHQVEGGQENDWTEWEKLGRARDRQISGAASDHWHRFSADFDLARDLGHNAHRFSIEWSRVEPTPGEWSEAAITHYRRVVSALRERNLEPFVTLWHFTNPQWMARRGGWLNAESLRVFARYARRIAEALPEVRYWITVNEPNVYALLSYLVGQWPPQQRSWRRAWAVYHRLAEAHRLAYRVLKSFRASSQVGFAQNLVWYEPTRPSHPLDRLVSAFAEATYNQRFIRQTASHTDFIGVNHYLRQRVRFGSFRRLLVNEPQGQPQSDFGWEMYPESMYHCLMSLQRYRTPVYITENGVADAADRWRRQYIGGYLHQVHRAIRDGVDVRGYFHWSLLDNFEWAEGYRQRFGLVAVDFQTQERTIRPSARFYEAICRRNGLADHA